MDKECQLPDFYTPILDTCLRWTVEKRFDSDPWAPRIFQYRIGQDTVIGSISYHALLSKHINDSIDTEEIIGLIRETTDGKIYQFNKIDFSEYLIYNFGVSLGDTVIIRNEFTEQKLIVSSLKSIIINKIARKKIILNCVCLPTTDEITWIEGIGSLNSLLSTNFHSVYCGNGGIVGFVSGGTLSKLICVQHKGQLIFESKL